MDFDIQEALRTYLDPDSSGGFQPIGGKERLRRSYGARFEQVMARIQAFLQPIVAFAYEPGVDRRAIGERVAARAKQLQPDLDPVLCRAIGNSVEYDWR
jgi:hypothetical protein